MSKDFRVHAGSMTDKVQLHAFEPEILEPTFKPYQPVLVRDSAKDKWLATHFSHYGDNKALPFITTGSCYYRQCIPYMTETAKLVGTTNKPKGVKKMKNIDEVYEQIGELQRLLIKNCTDETTSVIIFFNHEGFSTEHTTRTPESLKRDGLSMRNIKGEYIK